MVEVSDRGSGANDRSPSSINVVLTWSVLFPSDHCGRKNEKFKDNDIRFHVHLYQMCGSVGSRSLQRHLV